MIKLSRHRPIFWQVACSAALLCLGPALCSAKTTPPQSLLRGYWVSVDGTPPNLRFVPTGARGGQVAFGSKGVVDYHYYRLIGKNQIRIYDKKGDYRLRIRGKRLYMNKRGPVKARIFVKRPLSSIKPYRRR